MAYKGGSMKKKRILGLALAGVTALTGGFVLAGCTKDDTATTQDQTTELTTAQKIEKVNAVMDNFGAQITRIGQISVGATITKNPTYATETEFVNFGIDGTDTTIEDLTTITSQYQAGCLADLADYSSVPLCIKEIVKMDNFEFGTPYTIDAIGDVIIECGASNVRFVNINSGDAGIFDFNFNSDNKITEFITISFDGDETSYDKFIFDTTNIRALDCAISVQNITGASDNLQIYSERAGKQVRIIEELPLKALAELTNWNLIIQTYDMDNAIQIDDATQSAIDNILGD